MAKMKLLVADQSNLFCEGVCALLKSFADVEVVGSAANIAEVVDLVKAKSPDIVLMDMSMPTNHMDSAIRQIHRENVDVKVLLVSEHDDKNRILKGFRDGGAGYFPKRAGASDLRSAITALYRGGYFLHPSIARLVVTEYLNTKEKPSFAPRDSLTQREMEVLKLIVAGHKSREIADILQVKTNTVLGHRASIMSKLGLHKQTELVKYAIYNNLVEIEE